MPVVDRSGTARHEGRPPEKDVRPDDPLEHVQDGIGGRERVELGRNRRPTLAPGQRRPVLAAPEPGQHAPALARFEHPHGADVAVALERPLELTVDHRAAAGYGLRRRQPAQGMQTTRGKSTSTETSPPTTSCIARTWNVP